MILYRELSLDPMMLPKPGPGVIVVFSGALLIFGTLFLGDEQPAMMTNNAASRNEKETNCALSLDLK